MRSLILVSISSKSSFCFILCSLWCYLTLVTNESFFSFLISNVALSSFSFFVHSFFAFWSPWISPARLSYSFLSCSSFLMIYLLLLFSVYSFILVFSSSRLFWYLTLPCYILYCKLFKFSIAFSMSSCSSWMRLSFSSSFWVCQRLCYSSIFMLWIVFRSCFSFRYCFCYEYSSLCFWLFSISNCCLSVLAF